MFPWGNGLGDEIERGSPFFVEQLSSGHKALVVHARNPINILPSSAT